MKGKLKREGLLSFIMSIACFFSMSTLAFGQDASGGIAVRGTVSGDGEPLI